MSTKVLNISCIPFNNIIFKRLYEDKTITKAVSYNRNLDTCNAVSSIYVTQCDIKSTDQFERSIALFYIYVYSTTGDEHNSGQYLIMIKKLTCL